MSIKYHIFCGDVLASGELALAPDSLANHLAQLTVTPMCVQTGSDNSL